MIAFYCDALKQSLHFGVGERVAFEDGRVPDIAGQHEAAESLALGALDWLLGSARSTKEGLTWAATVPGAEANFTLYHGSAGIVSVLLEAQQHFGDDRYGDAATRAAAAIAAAADHEERCSLYFGLAGMAAALHAVHVQLGDSSAGAAALEETLPTRSPGQTILARTGLGFWNRHDDCDAVRRHRLAGSGRWQARSPITRSALACSPDKTLRAADREDRKACRRELVTRSRHDRDQDLRPGRACAVMGQRARAVSGNADARLGLSR